MVSKAKVTGPAQPAASQAPPPTLGCGLDELLTQLQSPDRAQRSDAWWALRDKLDENALHPLEHCYEKARPYWQQLLPQIARDPTAMLERRVAALRLMVMVPPAGETWVWQDTVYPLLQSKSTDEILPWVIYFLRYGGQGLRQDEPVFQQLLTLLAGDTAKLRMWTANALGDMAAAYYMPPNQRGRRSYLADKTVLAIAEQALIDQWDAEYDTYAARQIVISIGQSGGHLQPQGKRWPVVRMLTEAANHRDNLVRANAPQAIFSVAQNIAYGSSKLPAASAEALAELIGAFQRWLTPKRTDAEAYEPFREAVKLLADMLPLAYVGYQSQDKAADERHHRLATAILEALYQIAEADALKDNGYFRSRPLRAAAEVVDGMLQPGRDWLAPQVVERFYYFLADPEEEVATAAAAGLIKLLGAPKAAARFADIILTDEIVQRAANHYHNVWSSREQSGTLYDRTRARAARALAAIDNEDKKEALNRLVTAIQGKDMQLKGLADKALKMMGGETAATALLEADRKQYVEEQFFGPIKEASSQGNAILNEMRQKGIEAYNFTKTVAIIVVVIGMLLAGYSIWEMIFGGPNRAELFATGGLISSVLLLLGGLITTTFWNPASAVQKAVAELAKLMTAFYGYMGRMRLIGLGFAHAYTENNWDQTEFLTRMSDAAGEAMMDSASLLNDIGFWPGTTITVPNLLGKTSAEAEVEAKARGLDVVVKEMAYHDTQAQGQVCKQSPEADTQVKIGRTLDITLSMGQMPEGAAAQVKVPDFKTQTWAAAEQSAQTQGLTLTFQGACYDAAVAKDCIVEQKPAAGETLAKGSSVKLTLSMGPEPGTAEVPDFQKLTWEVAETRAEANGVAIALWPGKEMDFSSQAQGQVIGQEHPAGTLVKHGATIHLTVSKGPPPAQPTPDFTGMAWQDAAKLAQRIDIPLTYTLVAGDTANIGKVTAQQPPPDQSLSGQQAVNVTVNIGTNGQG
jgi:beta-lactam-binding protein with PASTA domain/HEAT repeat protein